VLVAQCTDVEPDLWTCRRRSHCRKTRRWPEGEVDVGPPRVDGAPCVGHGVGDDVVLCFSAGVRRDELVYGGARHQVGADEDTIDGGGAVSSGATFPICIHVGDEGLRGGRYELKTVANARC
jgi:hypothetical protein